MKFTLSKVAAAAIAAVAFTAPHAAFGSLVYNSQIFVSAQGFGNVPRDLTLQSPNNETFESGAVGVSNTGAITFGSAIADNLVFMGNGVTNSSSLSAGLVNPLADDQKYGIPTTGALGITNASQIGVLFNATEPAGNSVTITDLTLKFYTSTGGFLGAIDGQQTFASTLPGNGSAGFVFTIDDAQRPTVQGWLNQGGAGTKMALEASIGGVTGGATGGPESFTILNVGTVAAVPEPETYALMLAGLGALGFMSRRRRKV
jgi:hypothetical protein